MFKFKVCATSANLGIGFDTLGIALDIYNTYVVDLNPNWQFIGFEEEFANEDNNLFVKAYNRTLEYKGLKKDALRVEIENHIPIARGLGSSASLTVAGIYACSILHGNCLTKEEILKLASEIEGHPDNVAPAIYGGLCASNKDNILKIDVDKRYKFSLIIPDIKFSTIKARQVLPTHYQRSDVVENISSTIFAIKALENFDINNIKYIMNDTIHEPYRKTLIPHFDEIKDYVLNKGALAMIISGSGSSMLVISDSKLELEEKIYNCDIKDVKINLRGIIDV